MNITGTITLEAWVKTNSPSAQQGLVEKYDAHGGYALRLQGGRILFGVIKNREAGIVPCAPSEEDWDRVFPFQTCYDDYAYVTGSTLVSSGAWHHIAAVFDGSEYRVYLDGLLDGALPGGFGPSRNSTSLKIGARGDDAAYTFNGLIDEARITSGAIYSANFIPRLPLTVGVVVEAFDGAGVRGYWDFNDQTSTDFAGYNNHGSPILGAAYSTETNSDYQPRVVIQQPHTVNFEGFPYQWFGQFFEARFS